MRGLARICSSVHKLIFAHVLNPVWHSREVRRHRREEVLAQAMASYLRRSLKGEDLRHTAPVAPAGTAERIFSIWFQGEEKAPELVKSCWASMRRNTGLELVILDEHTLWDWITLPDYIMRKWKAGKICAANFSDICRAELLWKYGGYWMDATCFVPHAIPAEVSGSDFFIYMAGESVVGWYAFIQSCFIHARPGHPIVGAWCRAMHAYWRREDKAEDYFINLMLFRHAVTCHDEARCLFEQMPKVCQDATHAIWFGLHNQPYVEAQFEQLTSAVAFQKTTYRSPWATNPVPGSNADYIVGWHKRP